MTRPTIDELEMLNPEELGELLIAEIVKISPDLDYIQDLISVGCPFTGINKHGYSHLHLATNLNRFELVKLLISNGCDVNTKDLKDWTPLHLAATNDYLEMTRFLLQSGGNIHLETEDNQTPWDIASVRIRAIFQELNPKNRM